MCAFKNQGLCDRNFNDCVPTEMIVLLVKKQRDFDEHTIISFGAESLKLQEHNH